MRRPCWLALAVSLLCVVVQARSPSPPASPASPAPPSLFVAPPRKPFAHLYVSATHMLSDLHSEGEGGALEERVSGIIREAPLLSLQCLLTSFVALNFLATGVGLVPPALAARLRTQCLVTAALVGLLDVASRLHLAPFESRDAYVESEIGAAAEREVASLVSSPHSQSIAFHLTCCLLGSPRGCVAPFLVGQLPSLLRYCLLLAMAALPQMHTNAALKGLFFEGS
ncbi:hypothetical protein B484DRAFT_417578, partial [Ochromonadaceae sp. CCMP2298]